MSEIKTSESNEVTDWFNQFKTDNQTLTPEQLVDKIKAIEHEVARLKTQAYAALTMLREHKDQEKRAIDLVYGKKAMEYTPSKIAKDELANKTLEKVQATGLSKDDMLAALASFMERKGKK